jgi:hypothetical protein
LHPSFKGKRKSDGAGQTDQTIEHPNEQYPTMLEFLRGYLNSSGRDLYIAVNEQVRKNCDLVLDGMKSIDELAEEAAAHVRTAASSVQHCRKKIRNSQ